MRAFIKIKVVDYFLSPVGGCVTRCIFPTKKLLVNQYIYPAMNIIL